MNHWGRIFFCYEDGSLSRAIGQPLENHINNCREILSRFRDEFFHPGSRARLDKAVDLHDLGKRETFRITYATNKNGKTFQNEQRGPWGYSFAGHRFRVPHDDPYVAGLIRAHHEFSVEQINREKAMLKQEADRMRFPDDLYLLCMADQLEAELAVKTVENKNDVSRTFMEFTTWRPDPSSFDFTVIPWPFEPVSFHLTFKLMELQEPKLHKLAEKDKNTMNKWLRETGTFKSTEMTINLVREVVDGH
ncbi:MAG: hypothetical protein HQK56_03405 [Deltaproteobacteria bacterium]|nr:hypothetical protein [Deltaproteobacteria bacterium]